jgi:hypothetical protein
MLKGLFHVFIFIRDERFTHNPAVDSTSHRPHAAASCRRGLKEGGKRRLQLKPIIARYA